MDERIHNDWITAYLRYTEESEPPYLYKFWCGISAICSVLQRKCWTDWETRIYPNMFIVLVGPPGCRKGTAMKQSRKFLEETGVKMCAEAITREALIRELANSSVNLGVESEKINFHSSLTIFSEELTVFLGQNNWQLISDLNSFYDAHDMWTYRTKNMGEDEIYGLWVNLIGATTPDFLQSALPQDAIGGGLISRIVFVFGDRKSKLCPLPFKTEEEKRLEKTLAQDYEHIYMLKGEFRPTEEYQDEYLSWYVEQSETPPFKDENFLGYNERRATHVRKLSMAFSASRSSSMILEAEDLHRSIALLEETEKYMPFVFNGRGRLPFVKVFETIIRKLSVRGRMTYQEILEAHYRDITLDDLEKMVRTLEKSRIARAIHSGSDTILEFIPKAERLES